MNINYHLLPPVFMVVCGTRWKSLSACFTLPPVFRLIFIGNFWYATPSALRLDWMRLSLATSATQLNSAEAQLNIIRTRSSL